MFKPAYRHERRVLIVVHQEPVPVGLGRVSMHPIMAKIAEMEEVARSMVAVSAKEPVMKVRRRTAAAERELEFAMTSGAVVHNPTRLRQLIRLAGRRLR
jgi:hypothetical protein